jgi:hypothetical protein
MEDSASDSESLRTFRGKAAGDPDPEDEAARDLEERGDRKDAQVCGHGSKSAATNSRVPGGPVSSRNCLPDGGHHGVAVSRVVQTLRISVSSWSWRALTQGE